MRAISHNIYHWLFVIGTSFAQDFTALAAGLIVLVVAFFIFDTSGSDMIRIVVGIPVLIIGAATVIINLYGLIMALFSHRYSHNRCPFCDSPIRMVGSEMKIDCRKCERELRPTKEN